MVKTKNVGKISVVGLGPGSENLMTNSAKEAIVAADVIIGYKTYVKLISDLIDKQEINPAGMAEEVERAYEAMRLADLGKKVAVISSGDAGVYGMAGLVYEVLVANEWEPDKGIKLEVIPGISAVQSCASIIGAPLMHDTCTISLSDHLTPWDVIKSRLELASEADFVIALYNPKSKKRIQHLVEAHKIFLKHRSPDTPVGIVTNAYRDGQSEVVVKLKDLLEQEIGMTSTVIIGNSSSFNYKGKMITSRGYHKKYDLSSEKQELELNQRLRAEVEPWALNSKTDNG